MGGTAVVKMDFIPRNGGTKAGIKLADTTLIGVFMPAFDVAFMLKGCVKAVLSCYQQVGFIPSLG